MALLLLLAGAAELSLRAGIFRGEPIKFIAPVALVLMGAVLWFHTEYGTPEAVSESILMHRYQSAPIILAGILRAAELLWHQKQRWLAYPWIGMLLLAAILLVSYREPEGAYRNAPSFDSPYRPD